MVSLLGESFLETYGLLLILLIGLMVVMFIIPNAARKKQYQQLQNFINTLKVGDKVKTTSGFNGTIISIRETTDGKIALLEMGEGDKKGYIMVDMNAIYTVDSKEDVVRDSDGKVISPTSMVEKENNEKGKVSKKRKSQNEQSSTDATSTEEVGVADLTVDVLADNGTKIVDEDEAKAESKVKKSTSSKKSKK